MRTWKDAAPFVAILAALIALGHSAAMGAIPPSLFVASEGTNEVLRVPWHFGDGSILNLITRGGRQWRPIHRQLRGRSAQSLLLPNPADGAFGSAKSFGCSSIM